MKHKILIVDDEAANLRMLERLFVDAHEILTATSGVEALENLAIFDPAVIISDQRMPGMNGIEFFKKAAALRPHTVRIILTGYTDVSDLVEAINSNVVYKYITKPWVNTDLMQTVNRALDHYGATKTQHLMSLENERLEKRIKVTIEGFINGLREMISYKNSALAEHCRRTSHHAALIAARLGLESQQVEELTFASLLHEVPNMRMPFELAFTKTALTPEQHRVTRNNYENGLSLISNVPDLGDVAEIIRFQHEHYDGTGFFDGLDGDRIPIQSRILAVANAFDEISSGRNPALLRSGEAAADWLRRRSGIEFDPLVVETCLATQLNETAGRTVDMRPLEQLRSGVGLGL